MNGATNRNRLIGDTRDFIGGFVLLLLALFVLWSIRDLPGQRGFQLGPGSVPWLFAWMLAGNALLLMGVSIVRRGPRAQYSLVPSLAIAALSGVGVVSYSLAGPVAAVLALTGIAFVFIRQLTALQIRGPVFIAISILSFAAFIKPLGLFLTVFLLTAVSSAASTEYRIRESILWALGLATFSVVLFIVLLNIPVSAFPPSLLSR